MTMFFFFKQKTAYEMLISDWSSDVCSSDLHAFDAVIVDVGRGFRVRQYVARIEDVEALILHRAEVEVGNGDDIEHVQIIFPAIDPLIPGHAVLERDRKSVL